MSLKLIWKFQTNGVVLWSERPQGTASLVILFSRVSFNGFPQLQKIWFWIGVFIFHKDLHSWNKSGSESESADRLNFGVFISHLPHVTTKSTHMLRTGGQRGRERRFSSHALQLSLYSFPFASTIVYKKRWKLCIWGDPLHFHEGDGYRGGRRVFRAALREQKIASWAGSGLSSLGKKLLMLEKS